MYFIWTIIHCNTEIFHTHKMYHALCYTTPVKCTVFNSDRQNTIQNIAAYIYLSFHLFLIKIKF